MTPYHWLGPIAEREWAKWLAKVEPDAADMKRLQESVDE
jgi:hypothetical protein